MKRRKILFVCNGNTCRSPMAEYLFRAEIKRRKIKFVDSASAGIFAKDSSAMNPRSARCLEARGMDVSKFRPRQVTQAMIAKAYACVCMTREQKEILFCGQDNLYCMEEIAGFSVPDPYGGTQELYERTARLLERAAAAAAEKFFPDEGSAGKGEERREI